MGRLELPSELRDLSLQSYGGIVAEILSNGAGYFARWKRSPLRVLMKLRGVIYLPEFELSNQTVVILNRLSDYLGFSWHHRFKQIRLDEYGRLVFYYLCDHFDWWCGYRLNSYPFEQIGIGRVLYDLPKDGYVEKLLVDYRTLRVPAHLWSWFDKYRWVHQTLFHSGVLWSQAFMALAEDTMEYREEAWR